MNQRVNESRASESSVYLLEIKINLNIDTRITDKAINVRVQFKYSFTQELHYTIYCVYIV